MTPTSRATTPPLPRNEPMPRCGGALHRSTEMIERHTLTPHTVPGHVMAPGLEAKR